MPRTALFYPTWGIEDPYFMFDALLYWDRLACIVPFDDFRPGARWPGELQREADLLHERHVTGIAPTDQVKTVVHQRMEALLDTRPPSWCRPENFQPGGVTALSVRKLSPRTVEILADRGWLADGGGESRDISHAAAGILLGALAAEITTETMPALTDDPATFRATCNGLLRELQSRQGIGGSAIDEFHGLGAEGAEIGQAIVLARVGRLSIQEGELTPEALRRLSDLLQDASFIEQRSRFCERIDAYVAELRERPIAEHKLVHDHWKQELETDRQALKRELRAGGVKSLVEKEGVVATAVGTAAGAGALAAAGPKGLLIGLGIAGAGIADTARKRRKEIEEKHWTSWLVNSTSRVRRRY